MEYTTTTGAYSAQYGSLSSETGASTGWIKAGTAVGYGNFVPRFDMAAD